MDLLGLTRIPYYPELNVFDRENVPNDKLSIVLSLMLYWHSQNKFQRFNARNHLHQVARNIRIAPNIVKECLDYLVTLNILDKVEEKFETQSTQENKKEKLNEFYSLNFSVLHERLQEKGIDIPIKVLRLASDDYFDFYAYISPKRLPIVQGLVGMVHGETYEECALNVCKIICGICNDPLYEDFSYKALAPGWRMLCQPPADVEDVASRYTRDDERSIDIDLMDGSFFVPDGDFFGTEKHKIWHSGKAIEPRVLATALYLCFTAICDDMKFYSDLSVEELKPGFELLYKFTGLKGRLDDTYFNYLDLNGDKRTEALNSYNKILDNLN